MKEIFNKAWSSGAFGSLGATFFTIGIAQWRGIDFLGSSYWPAVVVGVGFSVYSVYIGRKVNTEFKEKVKEIKKE